MWPSLAGGIRRKCQPNSMCDQKAYQAFPQFAPISHFFRGTDYKGMHDQGNLTDVCPCPTNSSWFAAVSAAATDHRIQPARQPWTNPGSPAQLLPNVRKYMRRTAYLQEITGVGDNSEFHHAACNVRPACAYLIHFPRKKTKDTCIFYEVYCTSFRLIFVVSLDAV